MKGDVLSRYEGVKVQQYQAIDTSSSTARSFPVFVAREIVQLINVNIHVRLNIEWTRHSASPACQASLSAAALSEYGVATIKGPLSWQYNQLFCILDEPSGSLRNFQWKLP